MKKLLFMLLAFAMPAAVSAQGKMYYFDSEVFNLYARPYRDRVSRFESPRTEALQMSVAMNDASDQVTLENWGDNRADIRSGASQVKVFGGASGGKTYSGATKYTDSGSRFGAYTRFGRFEAEAFGENQKEERPTSVGEYHAFSGGAAAAFGTEALSFGLHANVNRTGDTDWTEVVNNNTAGAALAFKTDLYELGLTADFLDRGDREDSSNFDIPLQGPSLGAQAMLKPFAGFKAALRASMARLTADSAHNGSTKYLDYKADYNEMGARLEWRLEKLPLTFGLEYGGYFTDPNYTKLGVFKKSELDCSVKTAGVALRLLGERLLLGVEAKDLRMKQTGTSGTTVSRQSDDAQIMTGGAELWILPGFSARASVQKLQTGSGSSETNCTTLAGGLGIKGENFNLDASVRSEEQDQDAVNPDKLGSLNLAFTYKF